MKHLIVLLLLLSNTLSFGQTKDNIIVDKSLKSTNYIGFRLDEKYEEATSFQRTNTKISIQFKDSKNITDTSENNFDIVPNGYVELKFDEIKDRPALNFLLKYIGRKITPDGIAYTYIAISLNSHFPGANTIQYVPVKVNGKQQYYFKLTGYKDSDWKQPYREIHLLSVKAS